MASKWNKFTVGDLTRSTPAVDEVVKSTVKRAAEAGLGIDMPDLRLVAFAFGRFSECGASDEEFELIAQQWAELTPSLVNFNALCDMLYGVPYPYYTAADRKAGIDVVAIDEKGNEIKPIRESVAGEVLWTLTAPSKARKASSGAVIAKPTFRLAATK